MVSNSFNFIIVSQPQYGAVGPMKKQKGEAVSKRKQSKSTAVFKKAERIIETDKSKNKNKNGKTKKPGRSRKGKTGKEINTKDTANVQTTKMRASEIREDGKGIYGKQTSKRDGEKGTGTSLKLKGRTDTILNESKGKS